jgi:hypothetical protein
MLGGTDVVEVHYRPSSGIDKKIGFTINAYGPQQAREIIDYLVKKNPAIKVDSRIYRYL